MPTEPAGDVALPLVRLSSSGQHMQQCGLAGAVAPDKTDALARVSLAAGADEDVICAERNGNVADGKEAHVLFIVGSARRTGKGSRFPCVQRARQPLAGDERSPLVVDAAIDQ